MPDDDQMPNPEPVAEPGYKNPAVDPVVDPPSDPAPEPAAADPEPVPEPEPVVEEIAAPEPAEFDKVWVRREITLALLGESEETRARDNP